MAQLAACLEPFRQFHSRIIADEKSFVNSEFSVDANFVVCETWLKDGEEDAMQFVYDDGGRQDAGFRGKAGDCVTRAVAIASGLPYIEVYKEFAAQTGAQKATKRSAKRAASARNGVNVTRKWFKDWMRSQGFRWTPCMGIGTGCKVHLVDGELPMGRLVVSVSGHYTAVVDGVIHDTYNPCRDDMWTCEPDIGQELKSNQRRNVNGVWTKSGGRCVYGYWSR